MSDAAPEREPPDPADPADDQDIAALVEDWRKNRPDLSWKPVLSHHLQPGPTMLRWATGLFFLFVTAFAMSLVFLWSTPEQVREVTGQIWSVTTPKSGEYSYVVIALPDAPLLTLKYYGKERLERGQRVVLEEVTGRLSGTDYTFKDPPPGGE